MRLQVTGSSCWDLGGKMERFFPQRSDLRWAVARAAVGGVVGRVGGEGVVEVGGGGGGSSTSVTVRVAGPTEFGAKVVSVAVADMSRAWDVGSLGAGSCCVYV